MHCRSPAVIPAFAYLMRGLFEGAGCAHRLHYLEVSGEVCRARLRQRNEDGKHEFSVSGEQFDLFTSHFVRPSDEEMFDVILHRHWRSAGPSQTCANRIDERPLRADSVEKVG
jgi:hypothetical protein